MKAPTEHIRYVEDLALKAGDVYATKLWKDGTSMQVALSSEDFAAGYAAGRLDLEATCAFLLKQMYAVADIAASQNEPACASIARYTLTMLRKEYK